jgi:hypothetical protein
MLEEHLVNSSIVGKSFNKALITNPMVASHLAKVVLYFNGQSSGFGFQS